MSEIRSTRTDKKEWARASVTIQVLPNHTFNIITSSHFYAFFQADSMSVFSLLSEILGYPGIGLWVVGLRVDKNRI